MSRNTVDAEVFIGGSNWIAALTGIVGMSIVGNVVVTNEAFLGQRDEEASVHATGVTVNIDSMYEGTPVAALRSRAGQAARVAVVTPHNFEAYPIDVPSIPSVAGVVEPITSSLSMGQSDRGRYGFDDDMRALDAASTATTVDLSSSNSGYFVVTAITGTPTGVTLGKSTNTATIPVSVGIHPFTVPSAGAASDSVLTITGGSSPAVSGYVLLGDLQPLAEDSV